MIKQVSFKNGEGLILRGFVNEPKKYETAVISLHGFPGSCESKIQKRLLKNLGKLNYLTLIFDFSGSNKSQGKFENKLMSKEVKDIKYAIDFLCKNYKFKKLVLIGHSTGAIDASLYACKDKRINKLILSGAVSNLKHAAKYDFNDEQIKSFWEKGYIVYKWPGKWTHNKRIKKAFYDEFFTLDIPKAMKKYKKPLLIIHGEKDESVPLKNAKELYKLANKPKKLVVIKGAKHSYDNIKQFKQVVYHIKRFI